MKRVTAIIFSAGRYNYLKQTLQSFFQNICFDGIDMSIMLHEDLTSEYNEKTLKDVCSEFNIQKIITTNKNLGAAGSIHNAWSHVDDKTDYIWHQENDFTFNKKIKITDIISHIESSPLYLHQIAFLRQPVSSAESNGIYKIRGYNFEQLVWGDMKKYKCVIHKNFWTANPSLYRKCLTKEGYSKTPTEYEITNYLLKKYPDSYFAYWGGLEDTPMVYHIGTHRIGTYNI